MVQIFPIPILSDNYIWTIRKDSSLIIVDPGESTPVFAWMDSQGLAPDAIVLTHHHADHIGGVDEIVARWPVPVYGSARITQVTHPVGEGDRIKIGCIELDVWCVPGHTLDHLAYVGEGLVLCGDTLFGGGCGRLFEGTPEEMHASLQRLASLPADTLVCCTHEYTLGNLRFALTIEPDNQALIARMQRDAAARERNEPTLPSTIALERDTNPFLRVDVPAVRQAAVKMDASVDSTVACFAALRRAKDTFRG
ncbi:hydroxyacylglutathione hydrolase [Burkholderiaceae bacterium DAT-1]|nr:hydroxyacylglutathione hydrolase [Burkholderiaceae bacterium DAT-1]